MKTHRFHLALAVLAVLAAPALAAVSDQEAREEALLERLATARLVGKFTVDLPGQTQAPVDDRYTISSLTRNADGQWVFLYSMSYRDHEDSTLELPVTIEWAGDTPVLTMSDQTVEGLGTFSVRVLFYEDWYAGTWSNGPIGGHMWGRIETGPDSVDDDAPEP